MFVSFKIDFTCHTRPSMYVKYTLFGMACLSVAVVFWMKMVQYTIENRHCLNSQSRGW